MTSDELVRRSLRAIVASQFTLNCFRVVLTQQALDEAAAADRKRAAGEQLPLLGIPIAVKDDVDVAGVPTRFGAASNAAGHWRFRSRTPAARGRRGHRGQDQHLRVGSVAVHQRACLRPHLQSVVAQAHAGASSGGSAAAIAAGLVAAAIGSDGAGSVWIPAAWTQSASSRSAGVSPPGRCPRRSTEITVNGVLARTVTDAALVLDAASGNVDGDLHKPPPVRVSDYVGRAPGSLKSRCRLSSR